MKKSPKKYMEEWATIAILAILTLLVCTGVLSRYVFYWSFSFTEELTRYLLIWLTCLGFSAGYMRGEMIQFLWPGRHSEKRSAYFRWIGIVTGTLFSVILLFSSIQNSLLQWKYDQVTSVMGWPIVWVSAALPAGAILYLIRSFYGIWGSEKSG